MIRISWGWGQLERVAGNSLTRYSENHEILFGGVTFSSCHATRPRSTHQCTHMCMPNYNHSERKMKANLGCHSVQRQPSQMFLFWLNYTFQVFVWLAWQQVVSECKFNSYPQQISSYLIVSVHQQCFPCTWCQWQCICLGWVPWILSILQ